jgi:hypothetical protein
MARPARSRLALLLAAAFAWIAKPVGAGPHVGPVVSLAVSGSEVYAVSQAGVFLEGGAGATLLARPEFRVFGLAVVSRSREAGRILLLVGGRPGESGVVARLDVTTGGLETREIASDVVYDAAVSPDGKVAALACADQRVLTLALERFADGALDERHKHTAAVRAVAWSPDGVSLVSGGLDGVLLISKRNGNRAAQVLQQHSAGVESLTFSPDGRFFASGARDAKVRIHTVDGAYVRAYTGLGMETLRSGLERKPYVVALAWGGGSGALVAGTSSGGLYRLAEDDARWAGLEWSRSGPVFSLGFSERRGLLVGLDGGIEQVREN